MRDDDALPSVRGQDYRRTAAIMQEMAAIGECGAQGDSTRLRVDRSADGADAAFLGILLTVAQAEADGRGLGDELADGTVLRDEVERLVLADAEIDVHLRVVGHRHQRFADVAADERPYMPRYHGGHTADGTLHFGIAQVVASVHLLCPGLCQCGLSFLQGIAHGCY